MNTTVFLLLRLGIGISMFGHGMIRLTKLNAFSDWMVGSFAKSVLPAMLIRPFSLVLPFAELGIGLLLLVGLFTETAVFSGAVLMLVLIFGTTMVENWEALPSQLIHLAYFGLLLQFIASNTWAIDKILNK
jgi:thiosulfate dehydrogenase (quinone) large subunit